MTAADKNNNLVKVKDVIGGVCSFLSSLLLKEQSLTHVKQSNPGLFKIMSFPVWQQHLDALYYPCPVLLCRQPSEWQQRGQRSSSPHSENHRSLPNTAETYRDCCGYGASLYHQQKGKSGQQSGTRMSCNAKYLNVFSYAFLWSIWLQSLVPVRLLIPAQVA